MSVRWLVCFDTDRIKQYLLATNRLKEIRGGSALIAELDEKRKRHLTTKSSLQVVYSAGGGAAVLVSTEQEARELIAKIEREFRAQTVTASITGVYLKVTSRNFGEEITSRNFGEEITSENFGEEITFENFREEMSRAGKLLRRAKASKAELTTLPVEPYMRLCNSCGQHPAAHQAQDGSGDWLCRACHKKREVGHKRRKGFFDQFAKSADPNTWTEDTIPDDLDTIGSVASPPGYVGFIALDGNHAPFEIVLIGGDDVLLITAADIALEIALGIAEGFEEKSAVQVLAPAGLSGEREKLTMAGGVVLAHADFPIPAMYRLAEALQKSAKRLCAEQKYQTGAIDFQVVTSSDTDLDAMRQGVPHRRPYALADLRKLLGHIRQLKAADIPTSQLQAMYQALFEGEVNAQLASIATLGHLGRSADKTRYNQLRQFFADFGVKFEGNLPPWDAHKRSALTDLVELYPFITMREEK
jgi:CRISPR/Cas system-associated protein Cas10 (large subunit of type III CRISPR-Cas system)